MKIKKFWGHFEIETLTFDHLQYELRLVASDNLNENYTKIVIHVNDVNDNPPVFDRPTYETQITEEDDRNLPKRVLKVNKQSQKAFCTCFRSFPICCLLLICVLYT